MLFSKFANVTNLVVIDWQIALSYYELTSCLDLPSCCIISRVVPDMRLFWLFFSAGFCLKPDIRLYESSQVENRFDSDVRFMLFGYPCSVFP